MEKNFKIILLKLKVHKFGEWESLLISLNLLIFHMECRSLFFYYKFKLGSRFPSFELIMFRLVDKHEKSKFQRKMC